MNETVFIVKNYRLLKANFDDRQPSVKKIKHYVIVTLLSRPMTLS
jgi:hypothetical protein